MINTYQYTSKKHNCTVEIAFKDGIFYKGTIDELEVKDQTGVLSFPVTEAWFIQSMTESKNDTLVLIQENVTFEIFYNFYNYKHGSKLKALTAWNKLTKKEQLSAYHFIPAYKQRKTANGEFLQHAVTYLNQKVWE